LLILQADKTAAVNPMKELRIEKLVISALPPSLLSIGVADTNTLL
jgi:hypothetical protein